MPELIQFPIQSTFFDRRIDRMVMVSTAHLDPPGHWGNRPYETMIFLLDDDGAKNGTAGDGILIFPHYSPEAAAKAHRAITLRAKRKAMSENRRRQFRNQLRRQRKFDRRKELAHAN